MAITRTQIARQLYIKGGQVFPDGRRGFAGGAGQGSSDRGYQGGGRDKKGSVSGEAPGAGSKSDRSNTPSGADDRGSPIQNYNTVVATGKNPLNVDMKDPPALTDRDKNFYRENPFKKPFQFPSTIKLAQAGINRIMKKQLDQNRIDYFKKLGLYDEEEGIKDLSPRLQALADQGLLHTDEALKEIQKMGGTDGIQKFEDFMFEDKGSPGLKFAGNVGGLGTRSAVRDAEGNITGYTFDEKRGDGEGAMSDYERRLLALEQATASAAATPEVEEDEIVNYRLMADGGRAGFAEGGMPYEGGIMDLESSRQMYGLGKLVKKITRGVKKIAKSPIGKAALLATPFLMNPAARSGLASFLFKSPMAKGSGFGGFMEMLKGGMTGGGKFALGAGLTLAPFLAGDQEEEEEPMYAGADLPNPVNYYLSGKYRPNERLAADGGLMRLNYQEGGDAEPVAKKTMPLLDMDGQEMDLREEGGFVPLGRMERADDVPARLSKNEFVFTADAVRNAGEGDVDKGAEVMYNMMKNLESGGEVSEESQGLEGAREMFQTSQRLEEVI